ncbi:uncharacterized protein LOC107272930 [Cephus cinctus]|uniref:Regulatory protein zeste n=1 Tax=Cephus cinctus TaxID=211228 RepID=A0AAJ7CC35_CEPCN|nr:uncharacterized protein LOC107272930 [Cephus cinctus]
MTRRKNRKYSEKEKLCLVNFVQDNKHIIEDTCKCGTMRLQRKKKWIELSNTLLSMGFSHSWKELRLLYKTLKYKAKYKVTTWEEHYKGSDSKKSQTMPDKIDFVIAKLCSEESKMANKCFHECQLQGYTKNLTSISKKKQKINKSTINPIHQEQHQMEIDRDILDTTQTVMAVSLSESRANETTEKQSCAESLLELHKKQWTIRFELQLQEHDARMALLKEEERYKRIFNNYALEEKKMRIAILQKQLDNLEN